MHQTKDELKILALQWAMGMDIQHLWGNHTEWISIWEHRNPGLNKESIHRAMVRYNDTHTFRIKPDEIAP